MTVIQQGKGEYFLSIPLDYLYFRAMKRITISPGIYLGLNVSIPEFRKIYPVLSSNDDLIALKWTTASRRLRNSGLNMRRIASMPSVE